MGLNGTIANCVSPSSPPPTKSISQISKIILRALNTLQSVGTNSIVLAKPTKCVDYFSSKIRRVDFVLVCYMCFY